jgi:ATP-binding cassette subfamily B protein
MSMPKLTTFNKLWPFLWPESLPGVRWRFCLASAALILSKLSLLATPLVWKYVIDGLMANPLIIPYGLIICYGLARLASSLFSEVRDAVFAQVAQRTLRQVGLKVFEHLHTLSLKFHLDRQTGGVTRIIERGTKAIETLLTFLTFNILPTLFEIIAVSFALWWFYGPIFAFIILTTMAFYILYTLKLTEWRIQYVRSMNMNDNQAQTKAIDSLLNYETVKYFANESYEKQRFDIALSQYETAAVKNKISLSYLNIGQALIMSLGLIAVMIAASQGITTNSMTTGDLVAVNIFLIQLATPLFNLGFAYREIKLSLVNLEEMFQLLDEPQDIKDTPNAQAITFKGGEVTFDHVGFSYQSERPIFKDISFTIPAGKTLAVVGTSGAGKSTLSRLLFRFYDVNQGRICIDGQDIRHVTQHSLRELIGMVPQDTVLFNDTILYNIAYGRPEATQAEIEEAARQARLQDFIQSLPEGYQTRVGERGLKLSGGEKQRVGIARMLLKRPKIFVFDEATSALDTRTEKEIQENLRVISKEHTTLMIAHRLSTIVEADEIIVLEHGCIVENGHHTELLNRKGIYAAMWQRQQKQPIVFEQAV